MSFDGYVDPKDNERKLMRDCFEQGDVYLRTGDLLRRDRASYYYFVDRIGDTFRWKGENVATVEVEQLLNQAPGVHETAVYGVARSRHRRPRRHGAGGAGRRRGVRPDGVLRVRGTRRCRRTRGRCSCASRRRWTSPAPSRTARRACRTKAYDPARVGDALWFRDDAAQTYVPLDAALHGDIVAGRARL